VGDGVTERRLAYRIPEASALVGLSEREGWRRVAAGDWPTVKCGRVTLVLAVTIEDWLWRKLLEQNPDADRATELTISLGTNRHPV
jgi:hypothetical protein